VRHFAHPRKVRKVLAGQLWRIILIILAGLRGTRLDSVCVMQIIFNSPKPTGCKDAHFAQLRSLPNAHSNHNQTRRYKLALNGEGIAKWQRSMNARTSRI
jgi:hypothetical protein